MNRIADCGKKFSPMLSLWPIAVAAAVCSPCLSGATENIINLDQTVENGIEYRVKFPGSQETDPIWSLSIFPKPDWRHIPKSLTRPNIMWVWESQGGACGQAARIKCATYANPSELQFHSRIFTGLLEPCEAVPYVGPAGPPGPAAPPGPPPEKWTIDARTHFYEVWPEEETKCVGHPATFTAWYIDNVQPQQEQALSTWTCNPANGVTIDPAGPSKTVTVTAALPGTYQVTGKSVASANITDTAVLTVCTRVSGSVVTVYVKPDEGAFVPTGIYQVHSGNFNLSINLCDGAPATTVLITRKLFVVPNGPSITIIDSKNLSSPGNISYSESGTLPAFYSYKAGEIGEHTGTISVKWEALYPGGETVFDDDSNHYCPVKIRPITF